MNVAQAIQYVGDRAAQAGRPVVSGAGVRGMRGLQESVTVTPAGLVRMSLILSIALS